MFVVKSFNKNGIRHTNHCDRFSVNVNNHTIQLYSKNEPEALTIGIGQLYPNVYIENAAGKTIDAFKYIKTENTGRYEGFESFRCVCG